MSSNLRTNVPKGEKMKISSEIFQVGGDSYTSPEDAAVYLVNIEGHAALIDSGCGNQRQKLLDNIQACNVALENIEYLLLTHCHFDHTGGAQFLKEKLGCQVVAHKLDAGYLESGDNSVTAAKWYSASIEPVVVDRKLEAMEEIVDLGDRKITAIHIPGHSPGSVAYFMESDGQKVLFGQDVHGPLHPSLKSVRKDYIKSLKKLVSLEIDILCEGHYGIVRGKENIREFVRSFL